MHIRTIITTIPTIVDLLRDYTQSIPDDARPVAVKYLKSENGKIAVMLESASYTGTEKPIEAHFDLQRSYTVGGKN